MNGEDQFEKRLERQPLRPMPPVWREEILSAARRLPICTHHASPFIAPRSRVVLSTLSAQLSSLLWPHPRAWAGLAAAWLLVLGLNFAAREPAGETARQVVPPSRQLRELLHEQEQLLAELIGPMESAVVDRPKPAAPRTAQLRHRRDHSL